MRRMLITPMFSVVAVRSRILSSFSCSADEQGYGSWEGAQPDRNIPCHKWHARFMNGVGWGAGKYRLFGFPGLQILSCLGVRTFFRL